jgi:hypothetical protein
MLDICRFSVDLHGVGRKRPAAIKMPHSPRRRGSCIRRKAAAKKALYSTNKRLQVVLGAIPVGHDGVKRRSE